MSKHTHLTEDHSSSDYADVLFGRRIVEASEDQLALDDGTVLDIEPNHGCGGCPSGYYWIEHLNKHDNVIMNAELVATETADGGDRYSLFVYTNGLVTEVLRVEGDVGNGYYGSGFSITVKAPKEAT